MNKEELYKMEKSQLSSVYGIMCNKYEMEDSIMGIYIKGLEMPKDDKHILSITVNHDGTVYRNLDLKCATIATAIAVPEHGNLIDADVLCELCNNVIEHCVTPNDIMRFPVIIPADKTIDNQ